MGFIAKAATKKRVQPISGAVNDALTGTPWLTTGGVPAGALVRAVVLALDLTGARSSNIRGRTSAIASALAPTSASHLWVETNDFKSWDFVLGADDGRENIAADWAVRLKVDGSTATVGTARWHTKNDELVHGAHHDVLRNELLKALALGISHEADGEADVSASSLKIGPRFEAAGPAPFDLAFSLVTSLDEAVSRERLALMGYRVLGNSPETISWGLGLPKSEATDQVAISFGPGTLLGAAHVGSGRQADRRIAAHALRTFVDRALFLIRAKDGQAEYRGPEEWKP